MLFAQGDSAALWSQAIVGLITGSTAVFVSWLIAKHADERQDEQINVAAAQRRAQIDMEIEALKTASKEAKAQLTDFASVKAVQDAMLREIHEFRSEVRDAIAKLFDLTRNPVHLCMQQAAITELQTRQKNGLERIERTEEIMRHCESCRKASAEI